MSFSACACLSVGLLVSISPELRVQSLHLRVSFHLVCRVRVADRLHLSDSACPDSVLPVASQSDPELSTGPFCVTRSNPTHQPTDPTQRTTSGKIVTQPDPTQYN